MESRKQEKHKIRNDANLRIRLDSRLKEKVQEVAAAQSLTLTAYIKQLFISDLEKKDVEWRSKVA